LTHTVDRAFAAAIRQCNVVSLIYSIRFAQAISRPYLVRSRLCYSVASVCT